MARVLIADDGDLMRAGLAELLSSDPAIEVVGSAATGREAVEAVVRLRPDVVLMDIRGPLQHVVIGSAAAIPGRPSRSSLAPRSAPAPRPNL